MFTCASEEESLFSGCWWHLIQTFGAGEDTAVGRAVLQSWLLSGGQSSPCVEKRRDGYRVSKTGTQSKQETQSGRSDSCGSEQEPSAGLDICVVGTAEHSCYHCLFHCMETQYSVYFLLNWMGCMVILMEELCLGF